MKKYLINLAIEKAKKSQHKIQIGAVIFNKKITISCGYNDIRSNSIPKKYKVWQNSVHAEQDAVFNCKNWSKLKNCSILIVKVSKTLNLLSNAKPCDMCLGLLQYVGIKNIYYSDYNGNIVKYKKDI